MTDERNVLSVVGARPQFVKSGGVSRALVDQGIRETLVHTGQHFDPEMSELFFNELDLREPEVNLGIAGGGHARMTARMLEALGEVIEESAPDLVIVYGDTNSTLAAALAAAKLNIAVAHVEAGLRSFNRTMPEELNRVVTDHLSSLLLCPTTDSVANLHREGILEGVHHVGDVMYDTVRSVRDLLKSRVPAREALSLDARSYAVATIHRAENTNTVESLERVIGYLRASEMPVVLPLHPRTTKACREWGVSLEGLMPLPPVGYLDMASLVSDAALVMTDSGGLQKEAYFHRVPCVTMRDQTEWVETVEAGWNRLWTEDYVQPRRDIADYGTGHASEVIVTTIGEFLADPDRRN